jgi:hypothetical protein
VRYAVAVTVHAYHLFIGPPGLIAVHDGTPMSAEFARNHDRLARTNSLNFGGGVAFQLTEKVGVFATYGGSEYSGASVDNGRHELELPYTRVWAPESERETSCCLSMNAP